MAASCANSFFKALCSRWISFRFSFPYPHSTQRTSELQTPLPQTRHGFVQEPLHRSARWGPQCFHIQLRLQSFVELKVSHWQISFPVSCCNTICPIYTPLSKWGMPNATPFGTQAGRLSGNWGSPKRLLGVVDNRLPGTWGGGRPGAPQGLSQGRWCLSITGYNTEAIKVLRCMVK